MNNIYILLITLLIVFCIINYYITFIISIVVMLSCACANIINDLFDISFACFVNGKKRQEGNTRDMIFTIPRIISFLSTVWKLIPGDLIYTGTPSGVGVIGAHDEIVLDSPTLGRFTWTMF